jgi:RecA/RadA recombinase
MRPAAVADALKSILVMNLSSLDELLVALTTVIPSTAPRVVVVDSLAALVNCRLDATVATLSRLQTLAHRMKCLAANHNLTVVLVNHQVGSAEGVPKAAMGTIWQSVPNLRIFLDRRQVTWTATLVKSPSFKTQTVCVEL